MKQDIDGKLVDLTTEEVAEYNARQKEHEDNIPTAKLNIIKQLRLQKLQETDYLANSDVTMPDNIKTWRQSLRDIPANYTNEAAYDLLLTRDENGNLTHNIWSKP